MGRCGIGCRPLVLGLAGAALLGACSPIVHERGFAPEGERLAAVTVGESDRQSVAERLGAPTARAGFRPDTWFYIHQQIQQRAFLPRERTKQRVLVLHFDQSGTLAGKTTHTLADGRAIAHAQAKTPTQGSDISLVKQLLGNLGRVSGGP